MDGWIDKWTGVYIIQKIDTFAPPPLFQNDIFSTNYSENFLFSSLIPAVTPYIRDIDREIVVGDLPAHVVNFMGVLTLTPGSLAIRLIYL